MSASPCCDVTKLPVGMTGFSDMRKRGKIYVDKTAMLAKIARLDMPLFLSRPRRFGKSLLVDTLHSLFSRGLEDFRGLAIDGHWQDDLYRVVRIDFSSLADKEPQIFKKVLRNKLIDQFGVHDRNVALDCTGEYREPDETAGMIVSDLPDNSIVLLIDEYDAPLTHHLDTPEELRTIKSILNSFYAVIKEFSKKFRFIFITGITRTSQVSIFSAFNTIEDLSLKKEYNTLLGFTKTEIAHFFEIYLENAAHTLDVSQDAVCRRIEQYYDGFKFSVEAEETLFNPWSILKFLRNPGDGFQNYWAQSGGISSLVTNFLTARDNFDFINYDDREIIIDREQLSDRYELPHIPQEILLWQAGYFTLRSEKTGSLRLVPPNGEVEASLLRLYLMANNLRPVAHTREMIENLVVSIDEKDLPVIVQTFNAILNFCVSSHASIFNDERSVRDIIYTALFLYAPLQLFKERESVRGFSDLELITHRTHMVIEFKRTYPKGEKGAAPRDAKASLADAVKQLADHRYGETPFSVQSLFRVAMVISTEEKRILPGYCREL